MQTCVGCAKSAPETDTNYTLISAQFGWRLTRVKRPDGTVTLEWRCPNCWRDYKKTRGHAAAEADPGGMPASESPSSSGLAPKNAETAVRRRPSLLPAAAHAPPAGASAHKRPSRGTR